MRSNKNLLLTIIAIVSLSYEITGHSYVTSPQTRSNQKSTQSGCRGPSCLGPCDAPLASSKGPVGTFKRGDQITVKWPRNNHSGGFIRFAWAITSNSNDASAFDHNVHQINCHEVGGCMPSDPSNPNGGDYGSGDGSFQPCQQNLTVPGSLADGSWTLQWAWFGGAFALGDYYSCVDLSISGGPFSSMTPVFIGGDHSYPNQQKCKFFNTDRLHLCVNEICNNPNFPLYVQQSGPPAYIQLNADGSIIPAISNSSTSTTGKMSNSQSTTQGNSKMTTGIDKLTTGRVVQSMAATTASSSSSTSTVSTTSSSSTTCSVGQMQCLTRNSFSMCLFGSWGPSMNCAPGTQCQQVENVIQCGW